MPYRDLTKRKEYIKEYRLKNGVVLAGKRKEYYQKNRSQILEQARVYGVRNRNRILMYQTKYRLLEDKDKKAVYHAAYKKAHRKEVNEYVLQKKKNDIQFKLQVGLRNRLLRALDGNYKSGSAVADLGCTIDELKFYLERQFQDGMTWENWSRDGWHIDHKIPLAFFDLTDREQLLKAVHYTNLQPLWAVENLKKNKRRISI